MEIRKAGEQDLVRAVELIDQAKAHLKRLGVDQWQKGYPDAASLRGDLAAGNGYVLVDGGHTVGYACISFDGEESYDTLQGEWLSGRPYAVIHRMAVDDDYKGRGLGSVFFQFTQALCIARGVGSIKVDTDTDNAAMRHLLETCGFRYCGVIRFDNSDKIAFEKLL